MPIPFWAGHYIGLPFLERGRDPKKGLDCWGLVRLILREQFDHRLPSYTEFYDSTDNQETRRQVDQNNAVWLEFCTK